MKRGRGRPKLKVTQDRVIALRLTTKVHAGAEHIAKEDGTKVAGVARTALLLYLKQRGVFIS